QILIFMILILFAFEFLHLNRWNIKSQNEEGKEERFGENERRKDRRQEEEEEERGDSNRQILCTKKYICRECRQCLCGQKAVESMQHLYHPSCFKCVNCSKVFKKIYLYVYFSV